MFKIWICLRAIHFSVHISTKWCLNTNFHSSKIWPLTPLWKSYFFFKSFPSSRLGNTLNTYFRSNEQNLLIFENEDIENWMNIKYRYINLKFNAFCCECLQIGCAMKCFVICDWMNFHVYCAICWARVHGAFTNSLFTLHASNIWEIVTILIIS